MTGKRFHFGYVLGDTGLIDEQATDGKWFIENCCSCSDLKKNWITVCNKLNEVADENEQLKQQLNDITFNWNQNRIEFDKDTLYVKDKNIEIRLKNRNLYIKVFIPSIKEEFLFSYIVTGRRLEWGRME